jgi:hypothetical protein
MHARRFTPNFPILFAALALLLIPVGAAAWGWGSSTCTTTADLLASACKLELKEDTLVQLAICLNLTDHEERAECHVELFAAYGETREECRDQHEARRDLCEVLGEAPYDPEIDPDDFVAVIDNLFAPFAPGAHWAYEGDTEDGFERVEVDVLYETREILGVECTVVRDRVFLDGELIEDTFDWLAQDEDGNVWYFGEIAQNLEDGWLANIDGSWISGEGGAKPGFWVKAAPEEGEFYRQEWAPGEAEDVAEVISLDAQVDVPFANGQPVKQTRDFTPIEPDAEEFKFYVPGVGLVREVDPESGEHLDLVEFSP